MTAVIMNGWREGLQKVALTKLQTELLHKPLREAKTNVDQLLEGNSIVFQLENNDTAAFFMAKAQALGAFCRLA